MLSLSEREWLPLRRLMRYNYRMCQKVRFCVYAAPRITCGRGMMKGPSLHYDLRVLRVFCCDACGRRVQTPGHVTSHTCLCSDPPKFMRPLDRPRTVSPDVSSFISPADPADLVEDVEIEETPYVLHVPVKPPPPARFANRRKLYDDSAAEDQPEFGEGIVPDASSEANSRVELTNEVPQNTGNGSTVEPSETVAGDTGRPRRRRRGRGGSKDGDRPPGSAAVTHGGRLGGVQQNAAKTTGSESLIPNPESSSNRARHSAAKTTGEAKVNATANADESSEASEGDDDSVTTGDSLPEQLSPEQGEERRRRSRRRGRRRGPRPESGGV